MNRKAIVYACYLPGSTEPDYIGSHATEAPDRCYALKWRYTHCRYLGAGAWLYPDGRLTIPGICAKHSAWAAKLASMTPEELRAIRIETLTEADEGGRWAAEYAEILKRKPPFNKSGKRSEEEGRASYNAYHRRYRVGYYVRNPEKADAKREADRLRARAKRAEAKAAIA